MHSKFDVIIIGGGPGGYVAAIRASQLKLKVAVIEREHMGGICLNWGCIPTKALLHISEIVNTCRNAHHYGVNIENINFDVKKMVEYSRNVAAKLASGVQKLMDKNQISVIKGQAKILGPNEISVAVEGDSKELKISANDIVIATGARPRSIEQIPVDGKLIWDYKHAMTPNFIPKKLLIIGSGAIGVEFASFYNFLGSNVTIMEASSKILTTEDAEVSNYAKKSFEKRGIEIKTDCKVISADIRKNEVSITYQNSNETKSELFDCVILAIGVIANTQNLGLENTKVKLKSNSIVTDEYGETDEPSIYAIGDVASAPWLAHKASHEGILCIEKIAGLQVKPINKYNIPSCIYSYPQIASVGMTEETAKSNYKEIKIGKFPLYANGKAISANKTEGFVKTIFNSQTGELLGAHLIGPDVTELINALVIAKNLEAVEDDLIHTIFPHPTLSESIHESVLEAFKKAIHL